MPSIASFPDKDIDNTSIAQTSTAVASSGVHGEQASVSSMMQMMRQFMQDQNNEVNKTIETSIAQHLQSLNNAIAQEKAER